MFSLRRCFVSLIFCFEISPPQALIRGKNQCKRVLRFRGARLGRGHTHHVPNHCAAKQLQYVWLLPLIPHQALFAHKLFADLAFTNPPCLPIIVVLGAPRPAALGCSGVLRAALGCPGLLWAALGCAGLLWAALGRGRATCQMIAYLRTMTCTAQSSAAQDSAA